MFNEEMSLKVVFSLKSSIPAYGALAAIFFVSGSKSPIKVEFNQQQENDAVMLNSASERIIGTNLILRAVSSLYGEKFGLERVTRADRSQIDYWLDFTQDNITTGDFKGLSNSLDVLNNHLTLRSYFVGYQISIADFAVWGALRSSAIFNKLLKTGKMNSVYLGRWFAHMSSLQCVLTALNSLNSAKDAAKDRADQGSMDIPLPGAFEGGVVTRFPPEPSGYLHIGHAKAAMLNDYFARAYKGKMILRFDDTNPSKEKLEFEDSIKEDLRMLEVKHDMLSYTSSHFDQLYTLALQLINLGLAYVDDTDVDTMRNQRFDGIESKNRNLSIKENLGLFEEMKKGSERGLTCCLRAKIDMQDKNKCMRDPVIYRCNLTHHHKTGDKWKMYPTYDFACPIVDSIEGVTHALRTIEYRDRNPQYAWFIKALSLRNVHVWDFARLNFIYTLLSKRKLTWFVEEGHVTGWDDPRFPTVRGILRRGMTVEALRAYILSQGASQREISLEWDKIWTFNKKVIDPISPRFTAIVRSDRVTVKILDSSLGFSVENVPKFKKNLALGEKSVCFGPEILVEQQDAILFENEEEITLMGWGNSFVKNIKKDGNAIKSLDMILNLQGDFKKTKKKITWLCPGNTADTELTNLLLLDYDYLITKKKLDEGDSFEDCINKKTEFKVEALGEAHLRFVKKGDVIQLERKGFYICDKAFSVELPVVHLILIPDGRADSIALKAVVETAPEMEAKTPVPLAAEKETGSNMYECNSIYGNVSTGSAATMYKLDSIYPLDGISNPGKEKKKKAPQKPIIASEASIISKLDLCVGKVLEVKKHPDADSLYIETIDVGEPEPRQVVSGLVKFMEPEDIDGKMIIVLKNLKPVAMRGVKSYAMIMCASNSQHTKVELLVPPEGSKPGDKVYFEENLGEPETQLNPKKKVFETVQVDFSTDKDLVASWKGIPFRTKNGVVKSKTLANAAIK